MNPKERRPSLGPGKSGELHVLLEGVPGVVLAQERVVLWKLRGSSCNLTAASAHLVQIWSIPFALVTGPPEVRLRKTIFFKSVQVPTSFQVAFLVFESMWWRLEESMR